MYFAVVPNYFNILSFIYRKEIYSTYCFFIVIQFIFRNIKKFYYLSVTKDNNQVFTCKQLMLLQNKATLSQQ